MWHLNYTLYHTYHKSRKAVNLISVMRNSKFTDKSNNRPEMISFSNTTKLGVDTLDKIAYFPRGHSKWWPLTIFYNMIAVSLVNSAINLC